MREMSVWMLGACLAILATPLAAGERLSAVEVTNYIKGKTTVGATASGFGFVLHVAGDGSLSLELERYGSYTGKWRVNEEGHFCTQYRDLRSGRERCQWFEKVGTEIKSYIVPTNEPTYWEIKKD